MSKRPLVTFVVPCYKLGHLLKECVDSILRQSYEHLEVIVMDDCSPDDTPAIAASMGDRRVRYVRNENNLGHLRNYDRGIQLAQGEYLWLISADDKLRSADVLARFVDALAQNPQASFAFCPSVRFNSSGELDVYGAHGSSDRVFRRPELLRTLIYGNGVSAPAAMARIRFYRAIGGFPLDLPFAGDWYVWARFALDGDVAYLAEPMVGYRFHELNMTKTFTGPRAQALVRDEVEIAWRLRRDAIAGGDRASADLALDAVATDYSRRVVQSITGSSPFGTTPEAIEADLIARNATATEAALVRARVFAAAGDAYWDTGRSGEARSAYRTALSEGLNRKVTAKYLLASTGRPGRFARQTLTRVRSDLLRRRHLSPTSTW